MSNVISIGTYKEWAASVAGSYFSSGIEPNASVEKIASSYELTPDQIGILAAESNKTIFHEKFAKMEQKYFAADFPLADAKKIIQNLGCEKMASTGYFVDPIIQKESVDIVSMISNITGIPMEDTSDMQKTASIKENLKDFQIKLSKAKLTVRDELFEKKASVRNLEEKALSLVKEAMVLMDNESARLQMMGGVINMVHSAGLWKQASKTLAKIAYAVGELGLISREKANMLSDELIANGANECPAGLISEKLQGKVINGEHPLYITLNTLDETKRKIERLTTIGAGIDNRLGIIDQKLGQI